MTIGWTQNIVILEAELTSQERAWFIRAVQQFGWSKLEFQRMIAAMELEDLVQQMVFLLFFACSVSNFSIEEFTPSRYWFVEGVDGPWEWRMEVARRGMVAYCKLFSRKAGLVSQKWYPDLANYRRNGHDFDFHYKEGLASYREKCIMDVLLREGPTLSNDLKRMAGFGGDGLKIFDTIMTTQQMQTYVTVHSFEYVCDKIELWGDKNDQF